MANYYVAPHGKMFAVFREGRIRFRSTHRTKSDALAAARQLARNTQGQVIERR